MGWEHEPPLTPHEERLHAAYELLLGMLRDYAGRRPEDRYISNHTNPVWLLNQLRMVRWYCGSLRDGARVLDWGCRHAPDSLLLRAARGDRLELHGCDFP